MSRNLKQSRHFILLLLENNLDLNKHVLIHATPSQLKVVAEIFYNVFKLSLKGIGKEIHFQILLSRLSMKNITSKNTHILEVPLL